MAFFIAYQNHLRSVVRDVLPKNQNLKKVALAYPIRASGFHFFQKCLYIFWQHFRPKRCGSSGSTFGSEWQYFWLQMAVLLAPMAVLLAPMAVLLAPVAVLLA